VPSLRFTEQLRGYVTFGEPSFERGYRRGRASDAQLMFHLTIEVDDVGLLAVDPGRPADVTGYVRCEALGGRFTVERGTFNLFVAAVNDGPGRRMLYRLHVTDGTGHPLTLSGFKRLENGPATRLWPETTTLYTRIVQGHVDAEAEPGAELVAAGILRVRARDFLRQLTTFRASAPSARESVATLARFGGVFFGQLGRLYGPARR
jgi:cholesterol oxidase